jgi:probable F420-dependent oxidoreductase
VFDYSIGPPHEEEVAHMEIGVVLPQTEIGADPANIDAFARRAEDLGYSHVVLYDHVLGVVNADRDPPLLHALDEESMFHEPLVTLGFLAGRTTRIALMTGVLVLPQRQTALVAKQAAEVALLSNGRLRLGVGIGWNTVEYESLGAAFVDRGRRVEEQIEVLRLLWTRPVVDFEGRWHRVDRAGIRPLPGHIPLWFGGNSERAFRRGVVLGDGFFFRAGDVAPRLEAVRRVRALLAEQGRPRGEFGVEVQVGWPGGPVRWRSDLDALVAEEVDTVCLTAVGCGLSPADHIAALGYYMDAVSSWLG